MQYNLKNSFFIHNMNIYKHYSMICFTNLFTFYTQNYTFTNTIIRLFHLRLDNYYTIKIYENTKVCAKKKNFLSKKYIFEKKITFKFGLYVTIQDIFISLSVKTETLHKNHIKKCYFPF